jgi:hypothetical protein
MKITEKYKINPNTDENIRLYLEFYKTIVLKFYVSKIKSNT